MKRYFPFSLLLILAIAASSQKNLPPPGQIDPSDLKLQSCPFDPSAAAMKLFDVQEVEFDPKDYKTILTTERRVRIKIFNENGYKHASIRIPYYSRKKETKIKSLSGFVYNLDASGKVVVQPLDKKDFFKEKSEDNLGIVHFTFPNLKAGSVVEFSYTKIEKNILQIDPWIIQSDIPVAYAATTVIIPNESRLKHRVFGADTINQVTEKMRFDRNKTIFFRENIPSFQPEPFMSSHRDNQMKMIFLLIPRSSYLTDLIMDSKAIWKIAGDYLLNVITEITNKKIPGTEKIIDSANKFQSFEKKVGYVFSRVQKQFSEAGEQTIYANDLAEAWENKSANTAETNLILFSLLKKAGVTTYPLLVSTREHGKVNEEFPSIGQLNGVDVLVVDTAKYFVLDASQKFQSFRNPPFNVLNREALLLAKDKIEWITIDDNRPLVRQTINIVSHLKNDGKIEGTAWMYYYDYAKSFALDSTDDDEEKEDKFYDRSPLGLKILKAKQENAEVDSVPLVKEIIFEYEPQNTNDFYFVSPQFMADKKENPFTKTTRNTDIDFGCNQELTLKFQLDLGDGYRADQLPKNITVRAPDSSFFYKRIYTANQDSSVIFMAQIFEIQRSVFDKEEYEGVQQFFNLIFPLMTEELVIRRKK